jgi:hypothetical protein
MTSLATIIGLFPMALKLGAGSESYAPLARAIIGGLSVSVVLTIFLVPAAYLLIHGGRVTPHARGMQGDTWRWSLWCPPRSPAVRWTRLGG